MDLLTRLDSAFETIFEDIESRMDHLLQILVGKKSRWPEKDKPDATEKAKNFLRDAAQYDPTAGKNYMQFIAKQVASGLVVFPDDGVMLKTALEKFMAYSRKANWTYNKDIMQFGSWRDLLTTIAQYEEATEKASKTWSGSTGYTLDLKLDEGVETIIDVDVMCTPQCSECFGKDKVEEKDNGYRRLVPCKACDGGATKANTQPVNFKIYRITNPLAAAAYGRATTWCTALGLRESDIYKMVPPEDVDSVITQLTQPSEYKDHPWAGLPREKAKQIIVALNHGKLNLLHNYMSSNKLKVPDVDRMNAALQTASRYVSNGPLFVIYKLNKPYIQFNSNGNEVKNKMNDDLQTIGSSLIAVLKTVLGQELPEAMKQFVDVKSLQLGRLSPAVADRFNNVIKFSERRRR